jgi:4-hydroxy-3-methylbut-2-en-1-yl diphosphate reductase
MAQAYTKNCLSPLKTVYLFGPRGFCAGVVRAIDTVEVALQLYGPPVYVLHAIVHNQYVLKKLESQGAVFVETVAQVPRRATLVFSAHGISPSVREQAKERALHTIDATCPLVAKVHFEALRFARLGHTILLIGDRNHDEVEGTLGHAPEVMRVISSLEEAEKVLVADPTRVAYLTQTTLSQHDAADIIACLRRRFPSIQGPATSDICYATQNRQDAVEAGITEHQIELVLVIGSETSANSRRLVEVAGRMGVLSHLIGNAGAIEELWLDGVHRVALTAGASAPECLVQQALARLQDLGFVNVQDFNFVEEDVHFKLPNQLVPLRAISAPQTHSESQSLVLESGSQLHLEAS